MTLVIAGDASMLKKDTLLPSIREYFSKGDAGNRKNGGARDIGTRSLYAKDAFVHLEQKKTEQAHFVMAFPGLERHDPDKYALAVLSALFGGNMSSRLFTEIREKRGLCYYVRSDTDMYHDAGTFGAAAGVDKVRIDEAVKVLREEFQHLLDAKGSA